MSPRSPNRSTTGYKFSHATTGPYLPLPGKAPGWPFSGIGQWTIDVNEASEDWVRGLREWRQEHLIRIGFDDALYRRPELQWAQRNFVHALMMVEDRYFYDPVAGRYTVDRYLDDLERRYGGIDSVLIWYVYPNIGVDDRNQFDLAHDLPGGVEGLRSAIADFHQRGVKVFLPTMPWDNGTRKNSERDWDAMAAAGQGHRRGWRERRHLQWRAACVLRSVRCGSAVRSFSAGVHRARRRPHPDLERAELGQEDSAGRDPVRARSSSGSSRDTSSTSRIAGAATAPTTCSTCSSTASATTRGRTCGASGTSSRREMLRRCVVSRRCSASSRRCS